MEIFCYVFAQFNQYNEQQKEYKNEFANIFEISNVINLKNKIIQYCNLNKIPIIVKEYDDELLEVLSIFSSNEFKENFDTEYKLRILYNIRSYIISELIKIPNIGLLDKTNNFLSGIKTWILKRPNRQIQNIVEYISLMMNYVIEAKLDENFIEEYELCYSSILKAFDNISMKYLNSFDDNGYFKILLDNYEWLFNYLLDNGNIDKIGNYYNMIYNPKILEENINPTIIELIPLFCKNIIFPHPNYYQILFRNRHLLMDQKKKILPVGIAILNAFILEKQNNTYTFQFLNNLFIKTMEQEINKYKNEDGIESFSSFLKIIEQYLEV